MRKLRMGLRLKVINGVWMVKGVMKGDKGINEGLMRGERNNDFD